MQNFTYEGSVLQGKPHGFGVFKYKNGDIYNGECNMGKLEGFGEYKLLNGDKISGYFSNGYINGVGTIETTKIISKGPWINNKKHGVFIKTDKISNKTFAEKYENDILKGYPIETQYVHPEALITTKYNNTKIKKYLKDYDPNNNCISCYNNKANSTNTKCGHVVMCHNCLSKCKECPICKSPIEKLLKLYSG